MSVALRLGAERGGSSSQAPLHRRGADPHAVQNPIPAPRDPLPARTPLPPDPRAVQTGRPPTLLGAAHCLRREVPRATPAAPRVPAGHAAEARGVLARSDLRGLAGAAAHGDEEEDWPCARRAPGRGSWSGARPGPPPPARARCPTAGRGPSLSPQSFRAARPPPPTPGSPARGPQPACRSSAPGGGRGRRRGSAAAPRRPAGWAQGAQAAVRARGTSGRPSCPGRARSARGHAGPHALRARAQDPRVSGVPPDGRGFSAGAGALPLTPSSLPSCAHPETALSQGPSPPSRVVPPRRLLHPKCLESAPCSSQHGPRRGNGLVSGAG